MIPGRLLAQLAWVAHCDAAAQLPDPYEWPRTSPPPTAEQQREHDRLRVLSARLFTRAREAGYVHSGLAPVFGDEVDNHG